MNHDISIVIPVRNAERTIERCLRAIALSTVAPREVLLIDDGCTDDTLALASRFSPAVTIVPNRKPGGVAQARNYGASLAKGEIVLFVDADVILEPGASEAGARAIGDGGLDVAVGLQSAVSEFPNATSIYKNLWLRHTYSIRSGRFSVIYSSAVAIRKSAFEAVGGFDANYRKPNIEDSELGKRMSEAGFRVGLVREMQFLHIKRYSLSSMLHTDFDRTVGMTKVQLRDRFRRIRRENYTSIPTGFLVSCFAPWLVLAILLVGTIPGIFAWKTLLLIPPLVVVLLNFPWIAYLARRQGAFFAIKGIVLLHLDVLAVNAGLFWGAWEYALGRKY